MIHIQRETHEAPPEIAEILRAGGGLNRYGEPNYRLVWGQSRLDWIGGKWTDCADGETGASIREVIAVRRVPKYAVDRWVIERWFPPELYGSVETWEAQTFEKIDGVIVPTLGPYPSRGDYEMVFTLETSDGQFVQIDPMIARAFVSILEVSRELSHQSVTEFKSKAVAKQEREYDSYADSVLNDGSTIHGPMVAVP